MKILFMEWNSIGTLDMTDALKKAGHQVISCPFHQKTGRSNPQWEETFSQTLTCIHPDLVFSFNYFPIISTVCNRENVLYYSWVYDSPLHALYSHTICNSCNRVFLFDKELVYSLQERNVNTVAYLPLAVNTTRLSSMQLSKKQTGAPCDISFVGSLYTEEKHQLFKRLEGLDDYTKGYLNGLIQVQKNIYGSNVIRDCLSEDILARMLAAYPVYPHDDGMESVADIYTDYFLLREVTARERLEILTALGASFQGADIRLHTHNKALQIPGVSIFGEVDYYNQMPYVFKNSKINLNLSLRSIISGIPLRALDIMGCGGFLLTNYQADFLVFFEPDVDFVYYDDQKDLLEKVRYYLNHDRERKEIAARGYAKVRKNLDYSIALEKMFAMF